MSTSKAAKILEQPLEGNEQSAYIPPADLLLAGLGIEKKDLQQRKITVSSEYLRFLISKFAALTYFDAAWYASTYPDVEGARLAGEVDSLKDHFVTVGYLEGRFPSHPPFDAKFYKHHYADLGQVFSDDDIKGLWNHFFSKGYYEGRAGVAELLNETNQWTQGGKSRTP